MSELERLDPTLPQAGPKDERGTLVMLEQAEQALALVREQDEAETLWRKLAVIDAAAKLMQLHGDIQLRAARLRFRAERRWGELLGRPEEQERDEDGTYRVTGDDAVPGKVREARRRARVVADVPADVFDGYLATVREGEAVRRARLLRLHREREAEQRRQSSIATTKTLGNVETRHGDMRTVLDDLAGQVDVIVTDPPYPREFLPLWGDLGELAARLLTPNGVLVAMSGTMFLPEVLDHLRAHLRYRWTCAYLVPGSHARAWAAGFAQAWKPVVIFDRPGAERRMILHDVFRSDRPDKDAARQVDGWGQSETGMADIVEHLTQPGDLVVDPFMGTGTTGVVCRELGRRFVGCDVDGDSVLQARERLA